MNVIIKPFKKSIYRTLTSVFSYGILVLSSIGELYAAEFVQTTPAAQELIMFFNKPAENYGLASPLQSWKLESSNVHSKKNPDQAWEKFALPLGNGFNGAMLYGGINAERVQLNIDSLWSGGPGAKGWQKDWNKPSAHKHLSKIRALLLSGKTKEAQVLSDLHLRGNDNNSDDTMRLRFGSFQTLGELIIETGHGNYNKEKNYRRELNLSTGIHTVKYLHQEVSYTRTSFSSNPDKVLVLHFSANKKAKQNLTLKFFTPHNLKPTASGDIFIVSGTLENNGLNIDARISVIKQGGTIAINDNGIMVKDADTVTFLLVADTDYSAIYPTYRGKHPKVKNSQILTKAIVLGFDKLQENHINDHTNLHSRVKINLGDTNDSIRRLPLNERVKRNKEIPDHDLEELYFQFGRYLLMASSRPGSLPANLQGIWSNEIVPAWNADYHLNINLQMNYWLSGPTNLIETQEPLLQYISSLRKPGAITAKAYSNASGWTANLSSNIWGYTNPHSKKKGPRYWSYFPLAGSWLATHAFEQYAFTADKKYLKEVSWPIIAGSADFLVDYLYQLPSGELSSTPSWSPEHGRISIGTTTDIAMAREALKNALASAEVLGEKGRRIERWQAALTKLVPYKIGQYGQLQEWYKDVDKKKDKHRHLNHLFGLHPGSQISPVHTPKLAKAAKQSLIMRGDGATGWSMGWKINFWARLHDGDHAYLLFRNLLTKGTNPNLFDIHPPFQIDGNLGGTAGIAEMLLQSHYRASGGEIDLLPALPSAWLSGSFTGLLARGGYVVDMSWDQGRPKKVTVSAKKDGDLIIKFQDKIWHKKVKQGEIVELTY